MSDSDQEAGSDAQRIDRLERQVRWLTSVAAILALAFGGLLAWQFFPRTQPIQAPGFVVVDGNGKRRAELSLRRDGTPMLRLDNPEERARAVMFLRTDGSASVRLADAGGVNRAELAVRADGRPELSLGGPDGRAIATLGAASDSAGAIRLNAGAARRPWTAP